jgi:long chain fatty acid CoA FadD26
LAGALLDGRLLVTGRLKDVIIVDGRNHYPQDIEETVQSAVDLVRRDRLAAFGVTRADDTGEELVVVAEHRREIDPTEEETRARERDVRAAVSARHGLRLAALLLVPPGSVPRTSSGKVARAACRARFLDGGFDSW